MDPTHASAADLSDAIHRREISCREVMTAHLDRIATKNPELNAIVSLRDHDDLLAESARLDDELVAGRSRGWMHGLPQAIKDLEDTAGIRTTGGSRITSGRVPTTDSLMVSRMKAAGCIVIGKTNTPELGLGSHTFNQVFGITRNPYDRERSAGGSSGGAAVALATRMLPVADGSDYMGSLRNPAGWNNVFGFRPSQGRVPSWPSVDGYLAQLATNGPMGRHVVDVALLLGTQAGDDPRLPLSLTGRLDELDGTTRARRTLAEGHEPAPRVGWLGDIGGHLATEAGVLDTCALALGRLVELGCRVETTAFDMAPDEVWDAWLVWRALLVSAGVSALLGPDDRRDLVKPEALWELDRGRALTGADITRATQRRTRFFRSITALFEDFDVLALPSAQVWPFPVDERWPSQIAGRSMDTYHRWMEVTTYATFAGLPAACVPAGFDRRGLPMGVQLIGRPRADVEVLRLATRYERTTVDLRIGEA